MKTYMANAYKHFENEMDGAMEYVHMAKHADAEGDFKNAAFFRDMAREEHCHAKLWWKMITDSKMPLPVNQQELMDKWQNLEEAIEGL